MFSKQEYSIDNRRRLAHEWLDSEIIAFNDMWETGTPGVPPRTGRPPFSERQVRLARKRLKKRLEEVERQRWAQKMKAKEERKKIREAKALADQQTIQEKK